MKIKFCKDNDCYYFGHTTEKGRKCYYGVPLCWRGKLDFIFDFITFRIKRG
jgi:hypothetical protein